MKVFIERTQKQPYGGGKVTEAEPSHQVWFGLVCWVFFDDSSNDDSANHGWSWIFGTFKAFSNIFAFYVF